MKLSSKVLAGSLASAGMVLSLVAPAITAQAAKTSATVNDKGEVVANKKDDTTKEYELTDAGQLGKGNLAIAYDATGDGTDTGTATAESNAAVQVINGVLVLDKVPDFNFGAAAQKTTKVLQNNDRPEGNYEATDGNADGILQVTESRSKVPGFTLSAQLGKFVNSDNSAITTGGLGTDFQLNLKPTALTLNDKAYTNGNVPYTTSEATLKSTGNASDAQNVLQEKAGTYSTGTYAAQMNEKATDPASLYVGDMGKTGTDTPSVQSVHSTITWTLNAAAVANA